MERSLRYHLHVISVASVLIAEVLTVPAIAQSSPVISTSFGAPSMAVGETTLLTFSIVSNNEVTGLGFANSLPDGLVISSPNGFGGFNPADACSGGTVTATPGGGSIKLFGARLAGSSPASCTFAVNVRAVGAGTWNNSVTLLSDQGPGNTSNASIIVNRARTSAVISSSAEQVSVGGPLVFTVTVSSPIGIPTGTVRLQSNSEPFRNVTLSLDGTAVLPRPPLGAGVHTIVAEYEGDANFEPSRSPPITQVVKRATSTTIVIVSPNPTTVGQPVTLTATVGVQEGQPTGSVVFTEASLRLGVATLGTDRAAALLIPTPPAGSRIITAEYGGDGAFSGSASTIAVSVQPSSGIFDRLQSGVILFIGLALLAWVLVRLRNGFLILGRSLRRFSNRLGAALRSLPKPLVTILRILRIISRTPQTKPGVAAQSVAGVSVGAIARAFSGSKTDEAINENFDPETAKIRRHSRLFCTWLDPTGDDTGDAAGHHVQYNEGQAEADVVKASRFFRVDIPIESNPLDLWDDIDNAFIVKVFKESDNECFYVLSEFRKTITANVMMLSIVFALIVSGVMAVNVLLSSSIDFASFLRVNEISTPSALADFLPNLRTDNGRETLNRFIFGGFSCFIGFVIMLLFYHLEYDQFQRNNGNYMNTYLVTYLADMNNHFTNIKAYVAGTVVSNQSAEQMTRETVLWVTTLQWMAFRVYHIEQFFRNILFQIHRNSGYNLVFIPALFIGVLLVLAYIFNMNEFNILDVQSALYKQNSFYFFFGLLIVAYYRYLKKSLTFTWEAIERRRWHRFRQLELDGAMANIMEAYVNQLVLWREAFRGRSASPAPPPPPPAPPIPPAPPSRR